MVHFPVSSTNRDTDNNNYIVYRNLYSIYVFWRYIFNHFRSHDNRTATLTDVPSKHLLVSRYGSRNYRWDEPATHNASSNYLKKLKRGQYNRRRSHVHTTVNYIYSDILYTSPEILMSM